MIKVLVLLLLYHFAMFNRSVRGTLQCYSGFIGSNDRPLTNWTCDHITTHMMPVVEPDGNMTYTQVNYR